MDGSVLSGVDVVLYCTGYDYDLPFLQRPRLMRVEERAVHPVYRHVFHAYWPSLSFMGLLHSVVPFPMFDLQARWITRVVTGEAAVSACEPSARHNPGVTAAHCRCAALPNVSTLMPVCLPACLPVCRTAA